MVRIFVAWLILALSAGAFPLSATGRVPLRPADGIYDKEGWLQEPMRADLVRRILTPREKGNSWMFVVILPERPEDLAALAERLGREWGEGGLWGMVLHVVGEPGFPRYYAGLSRRTGWPKERREEFDHDLERAVQKVARGAGRLSDERDRVARGTGELAEELGHLAKVVESLDRSLAQARGGRRESIPEKSEPGMGDFLGKVGIACLILFGFLLLFLIFRKDEKEEDEGGSGGGGGGGFLFPELEPLKRFRAPWSGGGNVLVDFRRLRRKPRL